MLLTPKQRLVFRMHQKDGLAQVEIARQLKLRPESICRLLARANLRVKKFIGEHPKSSEMMEILMQ